MYQLLYNLIGYVQQSSYSNTYEMYVVQGAICIIMFLFVVIVDFLYKVIRSFVPKALR